MKKIQSSKKEKSLKQLDDDPDDEDFVPDMESGFNGMEALGITEALLPQSFAPRVVADDRINDTIKVVNVMGAFDSGIDGSINLLDVAMSIKNT